MALSDKAAERKAVPIATGFLDYFPDAVAAVAALSYIANEQHNPGTAVHWDRAKSGDEGDALMRHFMERGTLDTDGVRHTAKVAWRALALLQKEIESEQPDAVCAFPKCDCPKGQRCFDPTPSTLPWYAHAKDYDERAGSLEDAPYSRTTRSSIPFPHTEHRVNLGQFGRDF